MKQKLTPKQEKERAIQKIAKIQRKLIKKLICVKPKIKNLGRMFSISAEIRMLELEKAKIAAQPIPRFPLGGIANIEELSQSDKNIAESMISIAKEFGQSNVPWTHPGSSASFREKLESNPGSSLAEALKGWEREDCGVRRCLKCSANELLNKDNLCFFCVNNELFKLHGSPLEPKMPPIEDADCHPINN